MRMLDAASSCGVANIEAVRRMLLAEMHKPDTILVVICGDSPKIAEFADRVSVIVENSPWRRAIWVRDRQIVNRKYEDAWFGGAEDACAVVLGFSGEAVGRLHPKSSAYEIELSILEAMRKRGERGAVPEVSGRQAGGGCKTAFRPAQKSGSSA